MISMSNAELTEGTGFSFEVSSRLLPLVSEASCRNSLKEQVAYLKVWLGIVVVTDISLAGWLISSSESAASLTFFLALAGLVLLSAGIVVLHRRIERRIDRMREL